MIQWYKVMIIVDKSIHGNIVHRIELLLHCLKKRVLSQSLKDEFKINQDELACEEQQCFLGGGGKLINVHIQI
jgi:hypothetical protein